jgi:hypothetical protein
MGIIDMVGMLYQGIDKMLRLGTACSYKYVVS